MEPKTLRWFTAIPHVYKGDPAIWNRLVGDLCLGFGKIGVESRLVMLGESREHSDAPLITCTAAEMKDAAWWGRWKLDGVVLLSWGAPRYEPIARAIKESGCKLVVRLDSDGMKSPRIHFWRFLKASYFDSRQERKGFHIAHSVAKTLLFRFVPGLFDRGTCEHLSHADIVLIESPLGRQWLRRYLGSLGRADLAAKLRVLPHQAKAEIVYDPAIPKRAEILAVGRWDSFQKDGPKLMRVLAAVLPYYPEHAAILVGRGGDRLEKLRGDVPPGVQKQILIRGFLDHAALHRQYQQARVLLFTSRYEGFPVAASEALCCGCTVVGAGSLSAINYIGSLGGGTIALSRSTRDFVDALGSELDAWEAGDRDPGRISHEWQQRVSSTAVAAATIRFFSNQRRPG